MSYTFILSLCIENLTRLLQSSTQFLSREKVWPTIGVDLMGPLPPETPRKNKYIMTVSSKWPEATDLPHKTAIGVAESLFHCFKLPDMDVEKVKITDLGREFVNKAPYKQPHLHVCHNDIVFSMVNDEL